MLTLLLLSCRPLCLEPVTDVLADCRVPPELDAAVSAGSIANWDCSTPPTAPLRQIHADCGLDALGSADTFAWGDNSRASAALALWLRSEQLPEAWAASHLVAPPVADLPLPEGVGEALPDWPVLVVGLDGIEGVEGLVLDKGVLPPQPPAQPPHAIPALQREGSYLLAAHPEVPEATLSRIAASVDEARRVVVQGDRLVAAPIPTAEGPVCTDAWPGMDCVEGLYIDPQPATAEDLAACKADGGCRGTSTNWHRAREYCTWSGKRLPFAGELDEGPAVWTDTWTGKSELPLGPCDSAYPCAGKDRKLLSDGSSHPIASSGPGVRCVSDKVWSTEWPGWHLQERPAPAPLAALTDEQRALVADVTEDPVDEKPVCEGFKGHSTLSCRDPNHYVKPNEERQEIWYPYIRNLGGAYVGVGSDQGYTFAAIQKAEYAWLMDYDSVVVHVHRVNRVFFLESEDRESWAARWEDPGSEALIDQHHTGEEAKVLKQTFRAFRGKLRGHYQRELAGEGFLGSDENYQWVKTMWEQGRMKAVKGDMLHEDGALRSIGRAAEALGSPIRVYYTSNAPDAWMGHLTPGYKDNVLGLPMDMASVVLQVFGFPSGPQQKGYWHYNVQHGLEQQERMAREGYERVHLLVSPRRPTEDPDLTVSGLPQSLPW